MKGSRPCLVILSACLICFNTRTVSAVPDITLATRQETCETLFCGPNWDYWGESIGGWLNNLLQQPGSSPGLFVKPAPENQPTAPQPETVPPSPEILPPVPALEPQNSDFGQDLSLEPESTRVSPDPGTGRCQSVDFSTDSESQTTQQNDPGNVNFRECDRTTQQLIMPVDCGNIEQNEITARILGGMDAKFKTVPHANCKVEGAVFFWLAWLAPAQIESLNKEIGAVQSIMPNIKAEANPISVNPVDQSNVPDGFDLPDAPFRHKRSHRVEKRVKVNVVQRETEDASLSFLSTAPRKQLGARYSHLDPAGDGVTVYVIDSGLQNQPLEINPARVSHWIYGIGTKKIPRDESPLSEGQLGTCTAQKIGGASHGVADKVKFVIVKVNLDVGSMFSGLMDVISDLRLQLSRGKVIRGWTVINLRMAFAPKFDNAKYEADLRRYMEMAIQPLVREYEAIVVTSAGQGGELVPGAGIDGGFPPVKVYPAKLATSEDIITVGSVVATSGPNNGVRYPWSAGGSQVTVYAPGNGACANSLVTGDIISTATVSGLVAYYLSLPDLGKRLRKPKGKSGVPRAMKNYLRSMSFRRYVNPSDPARVEESVWNGLDDELVSVGTSFNQWFGTPPSKSGT